MITALLNWISLYIFLLHMSFVCRNQTKDFFNAMSNNLPQVKIDKIIELGKQNMFSVKEISKYAQASLYAVQAYLKKNGLRCLSTYEANDAKLFNKIQCAYEDDRSLSSLFIKFSSSYDAVIRFIDSLDAKMTDDVIVDVFADKTGMFAKSRYLSMKLRISKGIETKFESDCVSYFDMRFDDSSCLAETYLRLKHHIFGRPICEECGKPVKFMGSKKNGVF